MFQDAAEELVKKAQDPEFTIELKLAAIGVSLIGPMHPPVGVMRPVLRSELLYGQISDFHVSISMTLCL